VPMSSYVQIVIRCHYVTGLGINNRQFVLRLFNAFSLGMLFSCEVFQNNDLANLLI
jgi:hypothetical protein